MHKIRAQILPSIVLILTSIVIIAAIIFAIKTDFNTNYKEKISALNLKDATQISARDLAQQMSMAHHSYYQLILTFFSLVISMIGLITIYMSLKHTRDALHNTKTFGIAQTCAYLHVSSVEKSEIEGWLIKCKNTGNSPALDVIISSYVQSTKPPVGPRFKFPDDNCNIVGSVPSGDERPFVIRAPILDGADEYGVGSYFLISGTITYSDVFGSRYKSEFAFYKKTGKKGKFLLPAIALKTHHSIPTYRH